MTQIFLDLNASSKLRDLGQPVEVCDPTGHVLGRFFPLGSAHDVVATADLVDRIMAEDDANDPYLASYQSYTREDQR